MEPIRKPEKKFNQCLASIVANIVGVSWGSAIGWSSPVIAKMTDINLTDSPLDFIPSADQLSWIGSILPIGGLVGALVFAPLPGLIGRKWSLLLSSLTFIASFLILSFGHNIPAIYAARCLQGIGSGAVMVILPMYAGEISSADCRGIVSSFIQIELVVGILYAYCIGPYVSYMLFQWLCLAVSIVFIVTFIFMPETPHYYIAKGNREAALRSLKYLRGASADHVEKEMIEIEESVLESMKYNAGFAELFKDRANLIAMMIVVVLISLQSFSGVDAVLFYTETIFDKTGSSLNSAVSTILIGITMLVASCISTFFVDRSGRKGLLYVSTVGMTICLTIMGCYFFFDERDMAGKIGWLPVTTLIGFIVFYSVGLGPLPYTMLGEMLSPEIKSMVSSIAVSMCWIADFGVTKAFLPLESVVGTYGTFWIFAGFCAVAVVFIAVAVFETKGMTLTEIQDRLNVRNRSKKSAQI